MKKTNVKKKPKVESDRAEDIIAYWSILSGWDELSYEQKLEFYWRYEYKDGKRVLPGDLNE